MSSALVNRVTIINLRVEAEGWLKWAKANGVRADIVSFVTYMPDALMRPVPHEPQPFSTPRAWTLLSRALDLAETSGMLTRAVRRALSFGRVSPEDAAVFCALAEEAIEKMHPLEHYIKYPQALPKGDAARWFVLNSMRAHVRDGKLKGLTPRAVNKFLKSLETEHQLTLIGDLVGQWSALGADPAMLDLLRHVTKV